MNPLNIQPPKEFRAVEDALKTLTPHFPGLIISTVNAKGELRVRYHCPNIDVDQMNDVTHKQVLFDILSRRVEAAYQNAAKERAENLAAPEGKEAIPFPADR